MSHGTIRIGTSGWSYRAWRRDFYPADLPQRRELEYLAARTGSTELNGSFYSLQRPTSYRSWREAVPEGHVLAVKGSRYVTHLLRLRDVETPLANFFASGPLALGPVLGPILWQLPETLHLDVAVLADFLDLLPTTTAEAARLGRGHDDRISGDRVFTDADVDRPLRHAVEVRSSTFAAPAALDLLRDHGVACVRADAAARWPELDEDTADFRYARLHGHSRLYTSGYAATSLDAWAERCREWAEDRDVYLYFDNDARGRAPYDAVALQRRLGADVPDRAQG